MSFKTMKAAGTLVNLNTSWCIHNDNSKSKCYFGDILQLDPWLMVVRLKVDF